MNCEANPSAILTKGKVKECMASATANKEKSISDYPCNKKQNMKQAKDRSPPLPEINTPKGVKQKTRTQ